MTDAVKQDTTRVEIHSPLLNKKISFDATDGFADFLDREVRPLMEREKSESVLADTLSRESFIDGIVAEFGVFSGKTIKLISERFEDRKVFGFDSFEGLSHDWQLTGSDYKVKKDLFCTHGKLPDVNDNVELIKGYFDQTLPGFLEQNEGPMAFMHVDCDIYESTKVIFDLCEDRIVPGTVIVFDEFFDYMHEALAFYEYLERTGRSFEWICHGGDQGIMFDSKALALASKNIGFAQRMITSVYRVVNHTILSKKSLPHSAAVVIT